MGVGSSKEESKEAVVVKSTMTYNHAALESMGITVSTQNTSSNQLNFEQTANEGSGELYEAPREQSENEQGTFYSAHIEAVGSNLSKAPMVTKPLNLHVSFMDKQCYAQESKTIVRDIIETFQTNTKALHQLKFALANALDPNGNPVSEAGVSALVALLEQAGFNATRESAPAIIRRDSWQDGADDDLYATSNAPKDGVDDLYVAPVSVKSQLSDDSLCFAMGGKKTYSADEIKTMLTNNELEFMPVDKDFENGLQFYNKLYDFFGETINEEETGVYSAGVGTDLQRQPTYVAKKVGKKDKLSVLQKSIKVKSKKVETQENSSSDSDDESPKFDPDLYSVPNKSKSGKKKNASTKNNDGDSQEYLEIVVEPETAEGKQKSDGDKGQAAKGSDDEEFGGFPESDEDEIQPMYDMASPAPVHGMPAKTETKKEPRPPAALPTSASTSNNTKSKQKKSGKKSNKKQSKKGIEGKLRKGSLRFSTVKPKDMTGVVPLQSAVGPEGYLVPANKLFDAMKADEGAYSIIPEEEPQAAAISRDIQYQISIVKPDDLADFQWVIVLDVLKTLAGHQALEDEKDKGWGAWCSENMQAIKGVSVIALLTSGGLAVAGAAGAFNSKESGGSKFIPTLGSNNNPSTTSFNNLSTTTNTPWWTHLPTNDSTYSPADNATNFTTLSRRSTFTYTDRVVTKKTTVIKTEPKTKSKSSSSTPPKTKGKTSTSATKTNTRTKTHPKPKVKLNCKPGAKAKEGANIGLDEIFEAEVIDGDIDSANIKHVDASGIKVEVDGNPASPDSSGGVSINANPFARAKIRTANSKSFGLFNVTVEANAKGEGGDSSVGKTCDVIFENEVEEAKYKAPLGADGPVIMDEDGAAKPIGEITAEAGDTISEIKVNDVNGGTVEIEGESLAKDDGIAFDSEVSKVELKFKPKQDHFGNQTIQVTVTTANQEDESDTKEKVIKIKLRVKPKHDPVTVKGSKSATGDEKEFLEYDLDIEADGAGESPSGGVLEDLPADARVQEPDGSGGWNEISSSNGKFTPKGNGNFRVRFEDDGDFNFKYTPCVDDGEGNISCDYDEIDLNADVKCALDRTCEEDCDFYRDNRVCECLTDPENPFDFRSSPCKLVTHSCDGWEYDELVACSQRRDRRGVVDALIGIKQWLFGNQTPKSSPQGYQEAQAKKANEAAKARMGQNSGSKPGPRGGMGRKATGYRVFSGNASKVKGRARNMPKRTTRVPTR